MHTHSIFQSNPSIQNHKERIIITLLEVSALFLIPFVHPVYLGHFPYDLFSAPEASDTLSLKNPKPAGKGVRDTFALAHLTFPSSSQYFERHMKLLFPPSQAPATDVFTEFGRALLNFCSLLLLFIFSFMGICTLWGQNWHVPFCHESQAVEKVKTHLTLV